MKKRERLEASLRRHVDKWCVEPFAWGTADCLLSIADILSEARGYDPAEYFRGRYSTRRGALRITREFDGFTGAIEAMAEKCGWREINPRSAFVGDVGIQAGVRNGLCGLIKDRHLWLKRGLTGFSALPTEKVERAWRVK